MKITLALSFIVFSFSFSAIADQQQSRSAGNLQPYNNSAEAYIRTLFNTTCELAIKGEINANEPIDQATKGVLAQVTQGMEKGTAAYSVIHDTIILGAAAGLTISKKGKAIAKDKTELHSCSEVVSYVEKKGMISHAAAGLNGPKQSVTKKADNDVSDGNVYRTTAIALTALYDENEVAADDKIGGRKVEVKGVVQSIDKDFTGSVVVLLQSGNEYMPARFSMEDTEKAKSSRLRKGQDVTIICEKMMFLIGSPSGNRCRFN
ncbi:MAG: hypothetical protein RSE29_14500 [Leclercia sp.]